MEEKIKNFFNRKNSFLLLHHFFEYFSENYGSSLAVSFKKDQVTYQELNIQANIISHFLITMGIKPGCVIGICMERSIDLLAAILAVLKVGAAYVPLDPFVPSERIKVILNDSNPKLVLSDLNTIKNTVINGMRFFEISQIKEEKCYSTKNPNINFDQSSYCYIIYTSGTTGKPNGVCISHKNVVNLLKSAEAIFHFSQHDIWTLFHSCAFDFSVWEIWGAFGFGGKLVIVPESICRNSNDFFKLLIDERVTILNQTPASFYQLIDVAKKSNIQSSLNLSKVIFGGEILNIQRLSEWFNIFGDKNPELYNMYGITETTVHVTFYHITKQSLSKIGSIIGFPLPNYEVKIYKNDGNEAINGEIGEMYVIGPGVSDGYLNNEKLTSKRFFKNKNIMSYKTGDLAFFNTNGELVYYGRIDSQVKIRGYRIEMGDIEYALNMQPEVNLGIVMIKKNEKIERNQLISFVELREKFNLSSIEIKNRLSNLLPSYMVPSIIVFIKNIPLTENKKINRKKLLEDYISRKKLEK